MQLLKYGLKDGELVYIDDVPNGLSCGCVCPSCGGLLEAHQGEKNQYHFKHYSATDCEHGSESALHIMAKNIINQTKTVYVPNAPRNTYDFNPQGKCYKFENACIEKAIAPDVRSDVLLESDKVLLNVEIKVSHEIDMVKKYKLFNNDIRTIEIDLSNIVNDFDETKIRDIIESGEKTSLVYSPKAREIYAKWLLGEWKRKFIDGNGEPYIKGCRYAHDNEITYFMSADGRRRNRTSMECHECWSGDEFYNHESCFICRSLYGKLNYKDVEKIVEVKRVNNIVQYAELIVNGEIKTYGQK